MTDSPARILEERRAAMDRVVLAIAAEHDLPSASLADVPAVQIAYQRIEGPGNPPIPFVLEYDAQQIREGMQYSVRATIRHADKLLFTSDTHYPVLTRGAGNTADLLLIRAN